MLGRMNNENAGRRRLAAMGAIVALGVCIAGCSTHDPVGGASDIGVTPATTTLRPGERVRFQSSLSPPVSWRVVEGSRYGVVTSDGDFQAPSFPAASPVATVRASSGGSHADALVTLLKSPTEGEACFGGAQTRLPAYGEPVRVDAAPEAFTRVLPSYPDAAREAGVQGTVLVAALVCTSGRVIDTFPVASIPMLDGAAQQAVRLWVFRPAQAGGEPVAVWVNIPVRFSLH